MWRHRKILLGLAFLCFGACQSDNLADPQPVKHKAVSTSLCGDTYLQAFAPDHIAALSWQSRSQLSRASQNQKDLPQINTSAEIIMPWADHLVVFGPGEGQNIQNKLPQSYSLNWTENFDGIYENARSLMGALDLSEEPVISWYEDVKNLKEKTAPSPRPRLLYLTPAGGSAGPTTFVDMAITLAGGQNINTTPGWHSPTLETLLHYKPDIIISSFEHSDYHSRSNRLSPLVETHFKDTQRVIIEGKHWPCAGPFLLDATHILKDAVEAWHKNRKKTDEA